MIHYQIITPNGHKIVGQVENGATYENGQITTRHNKLSVVIPEGSVVVFGGDASVTPSPAIADTVRKAVDLVVAGGRSLTAYSDRYRLRKLKALMAEYDAREFHWK